MDINLFTALLKGIDPITASALVLVLILCGFTYKILAQLVSSRISPQEYLKDTRDLYEHTANELIEVRMDLRECISQQQRLMIENKKLQYKIDLTITELYRWTHEYPPEKSNITRLYEIVRSGKNYDGK